MLSDGTRGRKSAEPGVRGLPAAAEGHAERAGVQAAVHRRGTQRTQSGGEGPAAGKGNSYLRAAARKSLFRLLPSSFLLPCFQWGD